MWQKITIGNSFAYLFNIRSRLTQESHFVCCQLFPMYLLHCSAKYQPIWNHLIRKCYQHEILILEFLSKKPIHMILRYFLPNGIGLDQIEGELAIPTSWTGFVKFIIIMPISNARISCPLSLSWYCCGVIVM